MRVIIVPALVAALTVAACQSVEQRNAREEALAAEIAAHQGEEVARICFTSQLNGWKELGPRSVLLRQGVNDWYMLDLSGACEPEWAFNAIAIQSRPSGTSCISRGDMLRTLDRSSRGSCVINGIYAWNETPDEAESSDTDEPG